MLKYSIFLFLAIDCADPATISLTAYCSPNGSYQTGPTFASCSSTDQTASATVDAQLFYQDTLGGGAYFSGSPGVTTSVEPPVCDYSSCTLTFTNASFADDYVLTVTGGVGQGFFVPCMFAGGYGFGTEAQLASASFGNSTVTFGGSCAVPYPPFTPLIQLLPTPFTFGVPQTFPISLSIRFEDGGVEYADIWGFQFFDTFGNPITNAQFTLVSVDLPEPCAWSLLSIGLMFVLVLPMRGDFAYVSTIATDNDALASLVADQHFHAVIAFTNNSFEFAVNRWHNKSSPNSQFHAAV
jgi:hypothetical protein